MYRKLISLGAVLLLAGCAQTGAKRDYDWVGCAIVGGIAGGGYDKVKNDEGAAGAAVGATIGALLCGLTQQQEEVVMDMDGDGVADAIDRCAATPAGATVNAQGCPLDSDGDGVADYADACTGTPAGSAVDARGCVLDSDGDGVADTRDACPATPAGQRVDARGCLPDSDGDGVVDASDNCPATPPGTMVDPLGCPKDSDADGVADAEDACPNSARGAKVDARGCVPPPPKPLVLKGVEFLSNSSELTQPSLAVLADVVRSLRDNPEVRVEIGGHTDDRGPAEYNRKLSQQRAEAVRQHLIERGIGAGRLVARGYGEERPIADNATAGGRERNRRVELKRIR